MLDITLLGTGGMFPLPDRYLTSLMLRYKGDLFLVDCGEGTQVAARATGWGFKQLRAIFLTHFHGDHVAGLPGLLLTIGNAGRAEPLVIAGPPGVAQVVESLRVIAPELPFPIQYIDITENGWVGDFDGLQVSALAVPHGIPCLSYRIDIPRQGKFDVEKAKEMGIPPQSWSRLQGGETVEMDGRVITPEEVLGPPRKGISLCYATDMRPTPHLSAFAAGVDLFICEGMYGDPAKQEKAHQYQHCMFSEAASLARNAGAGELWLTHFSPSMSDPAQWLEQATNIFSNCFVDKRQATLAFSGS